MIKAVVILSIVAVASAGVVYDSAHVGAQSEQTVRGLGAFGQSTVSHQAKQVNSAFSSVSKSDTRVTNPALAVGVQPAVAYAAQPAYGYQQAVAAPVYQQQLAYAAQPAVQYAAQPAVVAAPVAKAVSYAAPSVTGSQVYSHQPAAPVAYAAQPAVAYAAQPAYQQYHQQVATYAAPVAKAVARVPSASYTGNAVAQPARVAAVAAPVAYAQPQYAAVAQPQYAAVAQPQYAAAPVAYHQPAVAKVAAAAPASLLGVAYSAVPGVATLSFDGFGVHYGY